MPSRATRASKTFPKAKSFGRWAAAFLAAGSACVALILAEVVGTTRHATAGAPSAARTPPPLTRGGDAVEPAVAAAVPVGARRLALVAPRVCVPTSCIGQRKECGPAVDGCGGTLDCGGCLDVDECVAGKCVFKCEPLKCSDLLAECGQVDDGCGQPLSCGTCPSGKTCGAGGVPNTCGQGTCRPHTCSERDLKSGRFSDGCSGLLDC